MTQEINFENYSGAFTVKITKRWTKPISEPKNATIIGHKIIVANGTAKFKLEHGGFQFYCEEMPFFWSTDLVDAIFDGKGNTLWKRKKKAAA